MLGGLTKVDQAALVNFNDAVMIGPGLTGDTGRVKAAIDRAEPTGNTALVDAAFAGMMLAESDVGRGLVIVFSDGLDTSSWLRPKAVARRGQAVGRCRVRGLGRPGHKSRIPGRPHRTDRRPAVQARIDPRSERGVSRSAGRVPAAILPELLAGRRVEGGVAHAHGARKGRSPTIRARPGYLAGQ